MIRALFTAATGLEAQKLNVDVIANNLANANTVGYKKARADFQDLYYQTVRAQGGISAEGSQIPSGIQVGLGVRPAAVQKIFVQGDFVQTGNNLDVAIEGEGFFQIQMPDGTTAYTRAGAFKIDSEGRIVNSDGYQLMPNVTIPNNTLNVTIGADGKVTVIQSGSAAPVEVGQIQIAKFTNPAGLKAIGRNLYQNTDASGEPILANPGNDGMGTLAQGFVEMSNVNVVEEMVNMIISQRAYEIASKTVQATEDILQMTNNLKR